MDHTLKIPKEKAEKFILFLLRHGRLIGAHGEGKNTIVTWQKNEKPENRRLIFRSPLSNQKQLV